MLTALAMGQWVAAQAPPDEAAAALMNSARVAYNERNYSVAAERFRTYTQKYPSRRYDVASAQFGLGLTLLEAEPKDYTGAVAALAPVAAVPDFPDRPFALYYLALAYRGQGNASLAEAIAKPGEAQNHRNVAVQRFTQAAASFGAAADTFAARVKTPPPADAKELPADLEWVVRARCDQSEMMLRSNRAKEALAAIDPILKNPNLSKSKYSKQAAYQQGYAQFILKDYVSAGRALATLAPFEDSEIGVHARYLLARTHHLAGERPEAAALYQALIAGYDNLKKAADAALKNPDALKDKPEEKAHFTAILNSPAPEYVAKASFYLGVLLYEQGKYADAAARFLAFVQQNPKSPMLPEAQLRLGMAQVQVKQFAQALNTLTPLQDHPLLSDQALRFLARAQVGAADPANLPAYDAAVKGAVQKLSLAVERVRAAQQTDPDAKIRRGDIMLELADAQEKAKMFSEAAATYQKIVASNYNPEATEEAMQGLATALQLAGRYAESDQACLQFQRTYPRSTLVPAVMFRYAENAYLMAMATANSTGANPAQAKQLYTEAISRYQKVIEKYPAFQYISLARHAMAAAQYQLGQYAAAAETLGKIPDTDMSGPLDSVPYLRADCLLRILPTDVATDDALAAARLLAQIEQIADLLNGYTAAHEVGPLTPDAAIKLGYCYQRMMELMAEPEARTQLLVKARGVYARYAISKMKPDNPLFPVAILEDAKVLGQIGGFAASVRELQRFQSEPLRNSPLATLAMIRLSEGMRTQRKPLEAATLLGQWRQQREAELLKDPKKAAWVPALQFGHAMSLKDAGNYTEARAILEGIAKAFPNEPEAAEVPLRLAQCRREQGTAQLDAAQKALAAAGGAPDKIQTAQAAIAEAIKNLRETAEYFKANADQLANKPERMETRLRMLYEAAWCYRSIAEIEIAQARQQMQANALKALTEKLAKENPSYKPNGPLKAPDIKASAIPLQPSEQKARELYNAVITVGIDAPLTLDARFELAELHAQRDEHDPAIVALAGGLQLDPAQDIADKMRLRLGACYLAKKDGKQAFAQFDAISKNPKSALTAYARYGSGESLFQQGNWKGAVEQLLPFQDHELLRHLLGTTDRALLRLGQAYAQLGQWDPSRRALEALSGRFPRSIWVHEARYGMGVAFQAQKQWDNAVSAYNEVINRTGQEIAAKAQIQIGVCRLEQQRANEALNAFMAVPYTYAYPDTCALALCEAARAHLALKQPAEATKTLQRVINEYPTSPHAELAKKRLAEIK